MIVGLGIDVAMIRRFLFDEAKAEWFARRIFTEAEFARALTRRRPEEHLAGCFAAKEATRKAFGMMLPWRSVEVLRGESGAPSLRLHAESSERASHLNIAKIHLSITHDAGVAAAVVVLEGSPCV